jgi:hypothetical protein
MYASYNRRAYFDRQRANSLRNDFAAQARAALDFADSRWTAFREVQPTVAAWIEAKAYTFDFAASMYGAILRYGDLTANQYDAVERCIQRDKAREVAPAVEQANVSAARVSAAFDAAARSGLRRPRITISGFQLSLAPATGRNPGAIYVKDNGAYVGKVVGGVFYPGRDFNGDRLQALQSVFADPAAAARNHGLETGECSCCGRLLTDPESVRKGIGPICEGRFGWSF